MIPPHAVVHQLGLQPCSFLIYGCLLIFFPRDSKITFFTTYSWAVYLLYLDMPIGSLNGLHYLARLPRLSMSDAITVLYVHLNTERTKNIIVYWGGFLRKGMAVCQNSSRAANHLEPVSSCLFGKHKWFFCYICFLKQLHKCGWLSKILTTKFWPAFHWNQIFYCASHISPWESWVRAFVHTLSPTFPA